MQITVLHFNADLHWKHILMENKKWTGDGQVNLSSDDVLCVYHVNN